MVWWARRQAKLQKRERAREILYLLDRAAEAAAKRKNQLYQSLDGSDNAALKALEETAAHSHFDISDELKEIDALWTKLSQQVGEFSCQSVQSTLRSSVVTSQAAQVSARITDLVNKTKKGIWKLNHFHKQNSERHLYFR
jgi:ketosteroid isomerase-like protein